LKNSSHMFYVEVSGNKRSHYIDKFHNEVVLTSHYLPLHSSMKGLEFKPGSKNFKESIELSETILRFPIHSHLDVGETKVKQILKILEKYFQ
jgi:dTDP-4-amino-4,6-dideoxygalactose transaminase